MADQLPDIDWDEFEDGRDPFDTGGFVSVDFADDLGYLLEFADSAGRRCQVAAADIVEAFLTLERDGRIPDLGEDWRSAMAFSLFEADRFSCMAPARFKEMRYLEDGICFTCSAEGHGVFEVGSETYLIERSTIVTAVLSLVEMEVLRPLPSTWTYSLRVAYEQICETWRHTRACCEGGPCDV